MLRGSSKNESIIGIKRCGKVDWLILINYLVFSICITVWAVNKARKEQLLKQQSKSRMMDDNIEYGGKKLRKLLTAAFVGGIVNALGLGGGVIFNPMLFSMGMCP